MRPTFEALLIAVTGTLLAAACYFSPFSQHTHWTAWCLWGFFCGFVLPLALAVALGRSPLQWGLTVGDWRLGLATIGVGFFAMLVLGLWVVHRPEFQAYYSPLAWQHQGAPLLFWLALLAYMTGWEFLFRGFLLFGLAGQPEQPTFLPRSPRVWGATAFSTMLFGLTHWGKPVLELLGSFLAGVLLCLIAWRTRSCFVPILLHTLVFGSFVVLVQLVTFKGR